MRVCVFVGLCVCDDADLSLTKQSPMSRRVLKGSNFKDQSFSSLCSVSGFPPWSRWLRARPRGAGMKTVTLEGLKDGSDTMSKYKRGRLETKAVFLPD